MKTNFTPNDYVVLKLDIEGAEYPVLESMLDSSLALVDELTVEFHWRRLDLPDMKERHQRLDLAIKQRGIEVRKW
jgi:hypothetical protein